MLRKILIYGILSGLAVGVPLSLLVITNEGGGGGMGMAIGYLMMLVALSLVFVAIKRHRDEELGGVIRFVPALGLGLGISVVAGIVYVIAWDSACAIAHLDFASAYADAIVAKQRAAGVSGVALARTIAEMNQFKIQYANPLFRWPMTFIEIFPVGVLVSFISAALLRNPRFLAAPRKADEEAGSETEAPANA